MPQTVGIQLPQPLSPDEWRKADDEAKLALAPPAEHARLAKEQAQLTAAEQAARVAQGSADRARAALVEARVDGRDHRKAEEHLETAEKVLASAKRSAAIQRDAVGAVGRPRSRRPRPGRV